MATNARLYVVGDIVAANLAAARPGTSGQRVQYWRWLSGHAEPRARADWKGNRQEGRHPTRARAERRHAPHLCRYVGGPPRPGIHPKGQSRERPRPAVSVAHEMNKSRTTLPIFCCVCLLAALTWVGCASNTPVTAAPGEADKLLLGRGDAALKERQWPSPPFYSTPSCSRRPRRAPAPTRAGFGYLSRENNSARTVSAQNYIASLRLPTTRALLLADQLGCVLNSVNPQREQKRGGDQRVPDLSTGFRTASSSRSAHGACAHQGPPSACTCGRNVYLRS